MASDAEKFFYIYLERVKVHFGHHLIAYKKNSTQKNNAIIANSTQMIQFAGAMGYHMRAAAYIGEGNLDDAIEDFGKVIEDMPDNGWLYELRGAAYGENEDLDLAIADFNTALKLEPDSASSYYYRSLAYLGKGKFDRAFADCNKALKLKFKAEHEKLDAYLIRGFLYGRNGNFNKAIADFETALQIELSAVNDGETDIEEDFHNEARKYLKYAIQAQTSPNDANSYCERGNEYYNKGDYDLAVIYCDKAVQLDPNNASMYYHLGCAYAGKEDYDSAIENFDKTIQLNPNHTNAYVNRGAIYINKDDNDRAITDFDKAILLDSNDAYAYGHRGMAYGNKGDFVRAIKDWETALRLDLNDNPVKETVKKAKRLAERFIDLKKETSSDEKEFTALAYKFRKIGFKKLAEECDIAAINARNAAIKDRYDRLVQEKNNASTESEYKNLANQFRAMNGYENTAELANECENQYCILEKHRENKELFLTFLRLAICGIIILAFVFFFKS
jgi:tetratricopeptide (TPR) repeat protein